ETEIPGFFKALDEYPGSFPTKIALRLLWLTLTRTNELLRAKWEEFDFGGPLDPEGYAPDAAGRAGSGPLAVDLAADAAPQPLLTQVQDLALSLAAGARRRIWLTNYGLRPGGLLSRDDRQDLLPPHAVPAYVWGAVLRGARGFFFREWADRTGPSSLAFPPRAGRSTLALSDEGGAVAETGCVLRTLADAVSEAEPAAPRYGVLVSWPSQLFDDRSGWHPAALLHALALAGLHDADVVSADDLASGAAARYSVLFAPHVTRLPPGGAGALDAFVRAGGVLIADSYHGHGGGDDAPAAALPSPLR
ncbi:MAG: hypothetical protein AAB368_07535, partial [bacterium]